MQQPNLYKHHGPYIWMPAHGKFGNKKHRDLKADVFKRVQEEYTFYTPSDVKLIQVRVLSLDLLFDAGIHNNMKWSFLTKTIISGLKTKENEMPFSCDQIQDILVTNQPFETAPAIDPSILQPFTAIPDNAIVYISQLKVDDHWIYFK